MHSRFCFSLSVIFALMIVCDPKKIFDFLELSEIPEIQNPFVCGSVNQCRGCEHCDDMCRFYNNNCCKGNSTQLVPSLEKWQYSCIRTFPDMETTGLDCWNTGQDVQGVFMVAKCSKYWTDSEQIFNCEENFDSLLSRIPVYENNSGHITYKNIYCALSTLCLYLCLKQLCNYHGNIMMNLMVSLFCAQLSFLVSFSFRNIKTACITFGISTHYFFLAAFCSMNAVGFDSFKTFSNLLVQGSRGTPVLLGILYCWMAPFVFVVPAVILDFADLSESPYRPQYGNGSCWINSSKGLLTFVFIPLAVFKLMDILLYAVTAVNIANAIRQGSVLKKTQNKCTFLINLKLALIMGLTWLFSFLATSLDSSFL
ncbi:G-protein coupled receptor Mth2-like [Mercenaria mercenaria]|uniref:G-protein coupled receptor Mth2-like n=1 Tax=Mercenaria mercenaria TaxID=6596 RepID=UPI00234F8DFA|nr:G-protein coupled receptor Mth2-like [Mercenaria mercenaria]